jgi:predicted DNA-binding transcriptional regulator AlpA
MRTNKDEWKTSGNSRTLSNKEAARLLGFNPNTLVKWRMNGFGPRFLKLGRHVRYRERELELWLNDRTFSSTTQYQTQSAGRERRSA